jgi:hypothetical protein
LNLLKFFWGWHLVSPNYIVSLMTSDLAVPAVPVGSNEINEMAKFVEYKGLGYLIWDDESDWWSCEIEIFPGQIVGVSVDPEESEDIEESLVFELASRTLALIKTSEFKMEYAPSAGYANRKLEVLSVAGSVECGVWKSEVSC